tara:strand:- start:556 stop:717 length:162 start_codon:yes stop_codon:yes gene_type:complete
MDFGNQSEGLVGELSFQPEAGIYEQRKLLFLLDFVSQIRSLIKAIPSLNPLGS